jgi:hypothetical protein
MHKGYTINFFINEVKNTSNRELATSVARAVAPRGGVNSGKFQALCGFLGSATTVRAIVNGSNKKLASLGKTPKTRLLRALRLRKAGNL